MRPAGLILCALFLNAAAGTPLHAQEPPQPTLRVIVQGGTYLVPDLVTDLRREFRAFRVDLEVVSSADDYRYNILLAQESGFGGAAAAIIVLDSAATFVTAVIRSGRITGGGSVNAAAKEIVKKIAALNGYQGP